MQLTPESHATVARFGRTIALVAATGGGFWCMGLPAQGIMALLCNAASMMALLSSYASREELTADAFGRSDEAAWFFLLGHVLRTGAQG